MRKIVLLVLCILFLSGCTVSVSSGWRYEPYPPHYYYYNHGWYHYGHHHYYPYYH